MSKRVTQDHRDRRPFLTAEDKWLLHLLGCGRHFGEVNSSSSTSWDEITCPEDMESDHHECIMEVVHILFSPIPNETRIVQREETYSWRGVEAQMTRRRKKEEAHRKLVREHAKTKVVAVAVEKKPKACRKGKKNND